MDVGRFLVTRALLIVAIVAFLVYLIGTITSEQIAVRVEKKVERVEEQLGAIAEAAAGYYKIGVATREGVDPWSLDFQFERVDELWPDLFSIVVDPDTKPTDPFDPERKPYLAATQGNTIVLMGVGPNAVLDVAPTELEEALDEGTWAGLVTGAWRYSPTNGSKSRGDIFFLGGYAD